MSIVTKKGDFGTTRLFSGEEIGKSHPRLETYGTLDELVSNLGLASSLCRDQSVRQIIHDIQLDLFKLGAELATSNPDNAPFAIPIMTTSNVEVLEKLVREIEPKLQLPPNFVIPGGCPGSAALDVARAVCRRLERRLIGLRECKGYDNPSALIYCNRLSDLCFLLARVEEKTAGVDYEVVTNHRSTNPNNSTQ